MSPLKAKGRPDPIPMAAEAIDYMRTTGFTPLFGWMIKSMGGRLTPVEAGFFHEISRRVVR